MASEEVPRVAKEGAIHAGDVLILPEIVGHEGDETHIIIVNVRLGYDVTRVLEALRFHIDAMYWTAFTGAVVRVNGAEQPMKMDSETGDVTISRWPCQPRTRNKPFDQGFMFEFCCAVPSSCLSVSGAFEVEVAAERNITPGYGFISLDETFSNLWGSTIAAWKVVRRQFATLKTRENFQDAYTRAAGGIAPFKQRMRQAAMSKTMNGRASMMFQMSPAFSIFFDVRLQIQGVFEGTIERVVLRAGRALLVDGVFIEKKDGVFSFDFPAFTRERPFMGHLAGGYFTGFEVYFRKNKTPDRPIVATVFGTAICPGKDVQTCLKPIHSLLHDIGDGTVLCYTGGAAGMMTLSDENRTKLNALAEVAFKG